MWPKERKEKRMYLIAEIKLKRMSEGQIYLVPAMAVNISKSGIGLYARDALKVNERVTVCVTILLKGAPTVSEEVAGTVRWAKAIGDSHASGIQFDSPISEKDAPILARCLDYTKCGENGGKPNGGHSC